MWAQKRENKAVASAEIQVSPNTESSNSAVAMTLDSLNQTPQYAAQKTKRDEIVADLTPSNKIANRKDVEINQNKSNLSVFIDEHIILYSMLILF